MTTTWYSAEITLPEDTDEHRLDLLSGAFWERGVAGIEIRDRERPTKLIASYPPDVDASEAELRSREALDAAFVVPLELFVRAEEPVDWATHWRKHFTPLSFGKLAIVPSWLSPPEGAEVVLTIDPSTAFGTGNHETTALCVERIVELSPLTTVLDVGTGSGILALSALRLGAEHATGTDEDPIALRVAKENAEINELEAKLALSEASPRELQRTYDFVVANILAGPLIELASEISSAIAPRGRLALSGILAEQADEVARAYEAEGLVDRVIVERGEWVRIDFVRP
ncbi:MAG: 50S ribosomal protein L11 methyltransferase [Deltaproteobacteria bacterium]|nr:50S ribosomal protein L11 methyltransferase [Deltaproteobacteria bacterium]